jgi:hypothetical protein
MKVAAAGADRMKVAAAGADRMKVAAAGADVWGVVHGLVRAFVQLNRTAR